MATKKDLSNLGDKEFMSAWTAASKGLEDAREACRAFSQEHQRRTEAELSQHQAEHVPSDLDQTARI